MTMQADLQAVNDYVRTQAGAGVVQAIDDANKRLVETGIVEKALRQGDAVPEFSLKDATGQTVAISGLLERGPVVLSFYRGAWCPYCNVELKALQARLDDITAAGATLVAISPQTPDHSLSTSEKLELRFSVLSDPGNAVARQFGLVFHLDPQLRPIYEAFGIDLKASNGTDSHELPLPATYVIARSGRIAHAYIDVDYRRRTNVEDVLAALKAMS